MYDQDTGKILRTGTCPESMIAIQAHDGERVMEGVANDLTQCICDGAVIDRVE